MPGGDYVSTWEDRMASRAAARRQSAEKAALPGEMAPGMPDAPRHWCASCGLPDAPVARKFDPPVPCPRCGSERRWHGRLADRDGTAAGPPDTGTCLACYDWRRYGPGQEHFGWAWWRTCAHGCTCAHHADEVWLA